MVLFSQNGKDIMLEVQKQVLKEVNADLPKEQRCDHLDDMPPNKQNRLLWIAINLLYKLIKKAIEKKRAKKAAATSTTKKS